MAYTLKTTGIATNLVVCVLIDDDNATIVDLKGNAFTLDTGVAASVAAGSWKGPTRYYFVTTANGTFDFNGLRFSVTRPTVDETDSDGMSAWFACDGASNASFGPAQFITIGSVSGNLHGIGRVSVIDAHGRYYKGGTPVATTTTNLPTNGTTKFSFGANYKSATDSEVFYGLESGNLSSEANAGSDGGFGGNHQTWEIGGTAGQGNQPFRPYICCVFNKKLTEAEFDSLHDNWFGTLIDAPASLMGRSIWMTA